MSAAELRIPAGSVAVRVHAFGAVEDELAASAAQPWPRPVRHLYEVLALKSPRVDVIDGRVPVSALVTAARVRLWHHLDIVNFVCAHLEELGWTIQAHGAHLIAHRVTTRDAAREALAARGLDGARLAVGDADRDGRPRLYSGEALAELGAVTQGVGEAGVTSRVEDV